MIIGLLPSQQNVSFSNIATTHLQTQNRVSTLVYGIMRKLLRIYKIPQQSMNKRLGTPEYQYLHPLEHHHTV